MTIIYTRQCNSETEKRLTDYLNIVKDLKVKRCTKVVEISRISLR